MTTKQQSYATNFLWENRMSIWSAHLLVGFSTVFILILRHTHCAISFDVLACIRFSLNLKTHLLFSLCGQRRKKLDQLYELAWRRESQGVAFWTSTSQYCVGYLLSREFASDFCVHMFTCSLGYCCQFCQCTPQIGEAWVLLLVCTNTTREARIFKPDNFYFKCKQYTTALESVRCNGDCSGSYFCHSLITDDLQVSVANVKSWTRAGTFDTADYTLDPWASIETLYHSLWHSEDLSPPCIVSVQINVINEFLFTDPGMYCLKSGMQMPIQYNFPCWRLIIRGLQTLCEWSWMMCFEVCIEWSCL